MPHRTNAPADDTARIASLFAEDLAAARKRLAVLMESRGMNAANGWRIHEEMLNTPAGFALRLRPVHRTELAPQELQEVVSLA